MNFEHMLIWRRLKKYQIHLPGFEGAFAEKLALDNNWSLSYAERVVKEYRKFLLLGIIAGGPVFPSTSVGLAWQLHRSSSPSYWTELCNQVMQSPFPVEPQQENQEGEKSSVCYDRTLKTYKKTFGEPPPSDIWPASPNTVGEHSSLVSRALFSFRWTYLLWALGLGYLLFLLWSTGPLNVPQDPWQAVVQYWEWAHEPENERNIYGVSIVLAIVTIALFAVRSSVANGYLVILFLLLGLWGLGGFGGLGGFFSRPPARFDPAFSILFWIVVIPALLASRRRRSSSRSAIWTPRLR